VFKVKLQYAFRIDLVLGQCPLERDGTQRRCRPPVLKLLGTLAMANAQIVERLLPAGGSKDRIGGVELVQRRVADVAGPRRVKRRTGAGKGSSEGGLQFVGIDAELFARTLQDIAEAVDFLRLPGPPRLRGVVHFGDGRRPQCFVLGRINFMGERLRLRNALSFELVCEPRWAICPAEPSCVGMSSVFRAKA
jgi:hypothetical protein